MRRTAELRAYGVSVGVLAVAAMISLIGKEGFGSFSTAHRAHRIIAWMKRS